MIYSQDILVRHFQQRTELSGPTFLVVQINTAGLICFGIRHAHFMYVCSSPCISLTSLPALQTERVFLYCLQFQLGLIPSRSSVPIFQSDNNNIVPSSPSPTDISTGALILYVCPKAESFDTSLSICNFGMKSPETVNSCGKKK